MTDVRVGPSPIHGIGVFATREFQPGETVLLIDDSRVVDDGHPLRADHGEFEHHRDFLANGRIVLMAVPERHINSSCDPNTFVKSVDEVRHVFSLRAIKAGEEITYDYLINTHDGDQWQCRCGSARCRGQMPSSFFDLPVPEQLRLLPLLDEWFVTEHRQRVPHC